MRQFTAKLFSGIFILLISSTALAQAEMNEIVVMNYYKFKFPSEVSVPEFDSLLYVYKTNVWDKNEYIQNFKILRHFWGNREKDFILFYQVMSWDDVIKVKQKNNELFEEFWPTQEERKKFNEAFNKYFDVKYPDEVYKEMDFDN